MISPEEHEPDGSEVDADEMDADEMQMGCPYCDGDGFVKVNKHLLAECAECGGTGWY